jgi:hypothetical protein
MVLVAFALTVLVFSKSEPVSWADASRMGSIQGLVEHHTLALDDTAYFYQGDKVRIGGPRSAGGHFYSHQPPMLAIVASIPYGLLYAGGRAIDSPGSYRIITIFVVGLPLLFGLVCLARLMRLAGANDRETSWLLAAASFGTLAWPYALVLNQHAPAAGLVMGALLQVQARRFVWSGVLLSLAATIDFTAAFLAVAMILPIARVGGRGAILRYGCAALPLLLLHFGINYSIVGDLKPLGLHSEGFEYPLSPFRLMSVTGGLDRTDTISLGAYAFGAFFGASGLFSHHPVLLFALATAVMGIGEQKQERVAPVGLVPSLDHALLLGSAGICLYYLLESRNYGGSAFGMRWFCVFAPSLMLLPAIWLGGRPKRRLRLLLFAPLLFWSVAAAGVGVVQPWAKFPYRWASSPAGIAAANRGEHFSTCEHWLRHLARIATFEPAFTEHTFAQEHLWLIDDHRNAYLYRKSWQSEEEYRAALEIGLATLERIVQLLDEEEIESASRPWGHYWLARFHRQLGDSEAAERELATTLSLRPDFYRDPFFEPKRERRKRKRLRQKPGWR